jgi:hypothetical protein
VLLFASPDLKQSETTRLAYRALWQAPTRDPGRAIPDGRRSSPIACLDRLTFRRGLDPDRSAAGGLVPMHGTILRR